jgi:uncharacterized protein (DUF305 family)
MLNASFFSESIRTFKSNCHINFSFSSDEVYTCEMSKFNVCSLKDEEEQMDIEEQEEEMAEEEMAEEEEEMVEEEEMAEEEDKMVEEEEEEEMGDKKPDEVSMDEDFHRIMVAHDRNATLISRVLVSLSG